MSDSLLAELPDDWRAMLDGHWTIFERLVRNYGRRVFREVDEARQHRGHRVAIRTVERWMADDVGIESRLAVWRRDRVAACAYRRLEESMRAARHLRASIITHYCGSGSCTFAPDALQCLYLDAGEPLKAALTSRFFHRRRGSAFAPPFGRFLTTVHVRRLVEELVSLHRDAPADPRVRASIGELGHEDAEARARALRALERLGPASSPALLAAAPSCAPGTREQIDALLSDWALTLAAERFFTPGPSAS